MLGGIHAECKELWTWGKGTAAIQVEDKLVNLSPGMAVSVEIKTGQRRLIEFFLSPLLKYGQESIRER